MEKNVRFDDLDGSVIEEGKGGTVTVGFGEEQYDLDLTEKNINTLKAAVEPFLEAGRKMQQEVTTRTTSTTQTTTNRRSTSKKNGTAQATSIPRQVSRSAQDRAALAEVRKWAKKKGFKISARGRIPHAIMAAYASENIGAMAGR